MENNSNGGLTESTLRGNATEGVPVVVLVGEMRTEGRTGPRNIFGSSEDSILLPLVTPGFPPRLGALDESVSAQLSLFFLSFIGFIQQYLRDLSAYFSNVS